VSVPPFLTGGGWLPLEFLTVPVGTLVDAGNIASAKIASLSSHQFKIRATGSYDLAWSCDGGGGQDLHIPFDFESTITLAPVRCLPLCSTGYLEIGVAIVNPPAATGHYTATDGDGNVIESGELSIRGVATVSMVRITRNGTQAQLKMVAGYGLSDATGTVEDESGGTSFLIINNAVPTAAIYTGSTEPDCPPDGGDVTYAGALSSASLLGVSLSVKICSPTFTFTCSPGGALNYRLNSLTITET
jgi:hypothetical protein